MKRKKFTSKFKLKVVLETLKEKEPLSSIANQHKLHPQQIRKWKAAFLANGERFFEGDKKERKSEEEKERERLLRGVCVGL